MKAPRDLVFLEAVDARFRATVAVVVATEALNAAKVLGIPPRIAGATRALDNARTHERQAKACLDAAFLDAAREEA